jgi:hypothetical protein
MKFVGMWNFGGGGTEEVTGVANENMPSHTENVCYNEKTLFSGEFTNLSRTLVHVTLSGFGSATNFHRHDLRAYESFVVKNLPLSSMSVYVEAGETIGFHGMGSLVEAEDEDEYAIMLAKSTMNEKLPNSPQFDTDDYDRVTVAAAQTGDLVASGADEDYALYKLTISAAAAQVVDVFWTDAANANIEFIGKISFADLGTWVYDFDTAMLRNPNRQGGKLRYTTTTAASTTFDCIGHEVHAGQ